MTSGNVPASECGASSTGERLPSATSTCTPRSSSGPGGDEERSPAEEKDGVTVTYEPAATATPTVPPSDTPATPAKPRRSGLSQALKLGITLGVSAYVLWQAGLSEA